MRARVSHRARRRPQQENIWPNLATKLTSAVSRPSQSLSQSLRLSSSLCIKLPCRQHSLTALLLGLLAIAAAVFPVPVQGRAHASASAAPRPRPGATVNQFPGLHRIQHNCISHYGCENRKILDYIIGVSLNMGSLVE